MDVLDGLEPKVLVPLVMSADELDDLLKTSADVVVADVRWYLDGRDARSIFQQGHISGAVFIDVDDDLSQPSTPTAGRHPLPSPEHFARAMGRLGIGDDTHVIAYDDTGGMTAGRLVVMLRALGRQASLLDGGIGAWTASGRTLEQGSVTARQHRAFTAQPWPDELLVTTDEVLAHSTGRSTNPAVLIDARPAERFRGDAASIDPRPGHVPGARNAPWSAVLENGRLRSPSALRAHFKSLGITRGSDVIASCGSGVSACLNVIALEWSGLTTARLFVPSWSSWASDDSLPIETGDHQIPELVAPSGSGIDGVNELRRARRRKRMAEVEWFEALYRVYLAAFIFGGGALFISGFVKDTPASASVVDDVLHFGPGWLGLLSVIAVAMGLRSGSRGGPLALEEAEVRHVLLAPVRRRRVLLRPTLQRWRSLTFAASMAGAFGGAVAATLFVGAGLLTHSLRVPRQISTLLGGALIVWQFVSALPSHASMLGPGDATGDLPLWGYRSRATDLITIPIAFVILLLGVVLLDRQSLEAQSRRAALVTQLRFAVTLQDLRTVLVIRRQLSHEQSRRKPWFKPARNRGFHSEWQRTIHGLLRFPLSRLARMVVLASVAGFASVGTLEGTTPLIVVSGIAFFLLGLEFLEPLAQEIDHGDRTDAYPVERGPMYLRLTHASIVFSAPFAAISVFIIGVSRADWWVVAVIGALPAITAGLAGAAINIVSGAPDPISSSAQSNLMPPEVAGTANVIKAIWPVLVAIVGQLPLVAAQAAAEKGQGAEAAAARTAIAVLLVVGLVGAWVHRRDAIRAWMDKAASESRSTSRGVS